MIQFNRALTPLFIYSLITSFLSNKRKTVKKTCASVGALLAIFSIAQYRYVSWGGIGDSLGYNIVITLIFLYFLTTKSSNTAKSKKTMDNRLSKLQIAKYLLLFCFSFLMIAYVCIYTFFLYFSFVLSDILYGAVKREKNIIDRFVALLAITAFAYIISILIPYMFPSTGIVELINSRFNPLVVKQTILSSYAHQTKAPGHLIFSKDRSLIYYIIHLYSLGFYWLNGLGAFALFCFGAVGLFLHDLSLDGKKTKLVLGFLLFLLLSQNNPFGLYFLPFPGAVPLAFVRRIYHQFFIYFSLIEGIGLTLGSMKAIQGFKQLFSHIQGQHPVNISTSLKVSMLFLLFLLPLSLNFQASQQGYQKCMVEARELTVLTENDIQAFHWIKTHIPKNKTLFTSRVDAGKWIYPLLDYTVLPLGRISLQQTHIDLQQLTRLLIEGRINATTRQILTKYQIDYVYIGQRRHTQFSFLPQQFNRSALKHANQTFTLAYTLGKVQIYAVTI